jgi:photosystem II stability/assembly factor-like uncharacterized protein
MSELRWAATGAPPASSRTDDIWFADALEGWAVNSNGHILHTADGGETWEQQHSAGGVYLRCVGFAGDQIGWVGSLETEYPLLHTTDGGATWSRVEGLPEVRSPSVCGLSVVDEQVVYAGGSNMPEEPTAIIKTLDGGEAWTGMDMSEHATLLVDMLFLDERRGFAVGGKADVPDPDRTDCIAVVLATEDGGETWENRLAPLRDELPRGEWGWKIQFVDELTGFVSLENFTDAAILKTVDGGATWERKPVNDPQDNANIEGIGFLDAQHGWAGGWGDESLQGGYTSETRDGGETWTDANHVGKFLNRFRFIREPELVGYAAGDTVYRYSAAPPAPGDGDGVAGPASAPGDGVTRTALPLRLPAPPDAASRPLRVDVWDRFGRHVATPVDEPSGVAEAGELVWTGETKWGRSAQAGTYIVRVTSGEDSESHTVVIRG